MGPASLRDRGLPPQSTGSCPRAPFPLCSQGPQEKGAGPEKGARSLNELRKAHLLTITAQASAITSCRDRQDVCLGAAACGSTAARVCPSLPEPEVSSGSSHRGSEGEEHFPFRTHPGRTRVEAGTAALPEGRSPGVPPTTPGETLSTFPGALPAPPVPRPQLPQPCGSATTSQGTGLAEGRGPHLPVEAPIFRAAL